MPGAATWTSASRDAVATGRSGARSRACSRCCASCSQTTLDWQRRCRQLNGDAASAALGAARLARPAAGASDVAAARRRRRPLGARSTADVADAAARTRRVLAGPGAARPRRRAQPRVPARLRRRSPSARDGGAATTSGRGASACTRVALRIRPEQLRAVAAQLYVELLRGGYTQVCEFHYLHHDRDGSALRRPAGDVVGARRCRRRGRHRPDAAAGALRARRLRRRRAARRPAPLSRSSPATVLALRDAVRAAARPLVDAGARDPLAARRERRRRSRRWRALADGFAGPIHIHVAEQTARGRRLHRRDRRAADRVAGPRRPARRALAARPRDPCDRAGDRRRSRRAAPASCCARAPRPTSATACPTCPAGSTPACRWRSAPTARSTRDWREELRLLEYGQRLARRERNVAAARRAAASRRAPSGSFARVLAGGAAAAGQPALGARRRRARRCARRRSARRCAARRRAASDRSTRSSSAARRRRGAT